MIYRTFRFGIAIRLILLVATIFAVAYFVQKPYYYFTTGELIVLAIILIVEMVHFVERGYRQINHMLEAVKERDFNLQFKAVERGTLFENQALLLTQLMRAYHEVRIEKELHFQFLTHIVDRLSYGIVCFDSEGRVHVANRAIKRLCGVNGLSNISGIGSIDEKLMHEVLQLNPNEEKLVSVVKGGEVLKLSVSGGHLKLLDKEYKLVTIHNIQSPLQEHELDSHKKLIRILTHEIMNSATPILSLSESINETLNHWHGEKPSLQQLTEQECIDIIQGYKAIELRSRALMRFVHDFRSLTRLPEPKLSTIKVDELVNGVLLLYKPLFDERQIKASYMADRMVDTIYADREMAEQVLINLLRNAMEALENTPRPAIDIETSIDDNRVAISVSDNGRGISPENLDKVFIPFYSTKKSGSGIGLSLSQQIMYLLRGSITVKSVPGVGTTMLLRFPHGLKYDL